MGAGLILGHPFSCKFPVGDLRENVKMCDLWFTYSEFSVNLLLNHVLERYNEYASSDLNKIYLETRSSLQLKTATVVNSLGDDEKSF